MNKEYEFTVFSPCYNSEKFIRRTFESLKNQTFKNFEWLVIDDCSSDATLDILNQLKAAQKALASVETNILETHLESCVTSAIKNSDDADAKISELTKLLKR